MRIAVDINDVLRDYTRNFTRCYIERIDHRLNLSDIELTTNNLRYVFPFDNDKQYNDFVFEDYAFELYGKCPATSSSVGPYFNDWVNKILPDMDVDEDIEVILVSPFELGNTIPNTYYFLSKMGCKVREVYFPMDSLTIWDRCDVLITANPTLLENKPEGKVSVKIKADYNDNINADFIFTTASAFFKEENNIENIYNYYGRK